jgi:hypothetical protein
MRFKLLFNPLFLKCRFNCLRGKYAYLKTYYIPILTHGVGTWTWTKAGTVSKLPPEVMRFLENIERNPNRNRIGNKK